MTSPFKTRIDFDYCDQCVNEDVCTPCNVCVVDGGQLYDVPLITALRDGSINREQFLEYAKKEGRLTIAREYISKHEKTKTANRNGR